MLFAYTHIIHMNMHARSNAHAGSGLARVGAYAHCGYFAVYNDERLGNACVVDVQVYMKRLDSFALQSDLLFIRRRRAHVPVLFTRTLFAIDSIICMHLLLMLVCFSLSTA